MSDFQSWDSVARHLGRTSAEVLFRLWPNASDTAANAFIERCGDDLCQMMLTRQVEHEEIIRVLDVLSATYADRLAKLDLAAMRPGGRA